MALSGCIDVMEIRLRSAMPPEPTPRTTNPAARWVNRLYQRRRGSGSDVERDERGARMVAVKSHVVHARGQEAVGRVTLLRPQHYRDSRVRACQRQR